MSDKDTVGSAFPQYKFDRVAEEKMNEQGLRDDFAARAMQGELSVQGEAYGIWHDVDKLALRAYQIADAMLKARKA